MVGHFAATLWPTARGPSLSGQCLPGPKPNHSCACNHPDPAHNREVPLGPENGLPRASVANLDAIYTISKRQMQERITSLQPDKLEAVDSAIHFALGLET